VQHGLDLVVPVADAPDGAPDAGQRPPGDEVAGNGAKAEVVGDGRVLAVQNLDVGQMQQVFGDRDGLRAGVAGGEQIGGFVGDGDLQVACAARQPQVGVEGFDGVGAEAELLPGLVTHDDAELSVLGGFAEPAAPGVEAEQGGADCVVAEPVERGQRQGLDGGCPVDGEGGRGVEQAGQGAGDQLAEGVAQQPGVVQK
jgi:hypothetical protein